MSEQHVVFVGLDGVQLEQAMLLGLRGGAEALNSLDIVESYTGGQQGTETQQPTVSGPGWSTLLSGVWANLHGVVTNNAAPIAPGADSVFELIDAGIADATIASVVNWADINTGHFSADVASGAIDYAISGLSDSAVTDKVVELIGTVAPDFTFLQLDDVDGAGHNFGFGTEYFSALDTISRQLGQILAAVDAREAANPDENWLVIVSTDHGRDPNTGSGHGGQTDMERRTFIAANQDLGTFGEPVPATSVISTILDFLDIPFTVSAGGLQSGSVLEGAGDPMPPTIEAFLTPADDEGRVAVDTSLSLRFSEAVQAGSGFITIRAAADDSIAAVIDVTSAAVSIQGDTVTIALPGALAAETSYYVQIGEGAFTDGSNAFFGLSGSGGWNFTTEADVIAPILVGTTPADDATAVAVDADLTMRFSEKMVAGTGNIVVHRADDGSIVETIAADSAAVRIDGTTVSIDLAGTLEAGVDYYVQVDAGALRDTSTRVTLFSEDFEGVPLKPFVSASEKGGDGTDFNEEAPAGWTKDNTTTPEGGPLEFFGWTVLDRDFWTATADDQLRSEFTNASGAVLVADPDEYDDGAVDTGDDMFNAYIKTPSISLAGIAAGTASVTFDSSWRAEGTQKASLDVSYDGGTSWTRVMLFDSDSSSADFKPDATNETLTIALDNPEGAEAAIIRFGMIDAGNNWWWAVDDITVQGMGQGAGQTGNAFAGISDTTSWTFSTAAAGRLVEGDGLADTLEGGAGADTILGFEGRDLIRGGEGDDVVDAGRGLDTVLGGGGNDLVDGGLAHDWLDGEAGDDVLEGGGGADTLLGGIGSDTLLGGSGSDSLLGGEDGDQLLGGIGHDLLDGGRGNDLLLGEQGCDTLLGGAGADTLDGGVADDRIAGGEGDDLLLGGAGSDVFVFGPGGGSDVVLDFTVRDRISLEGDLGLDSMERLDIGEDGVLDTVLHFSDGSSATLIAFTGTVMPELVIA